MGTTTLTTIRQEVLEEIGDYRAETTTSAGTTTTLLATPLANKPNDYYNDWWVILTSGDNSGVARQVNDFVSAAGSISVYTAWTAVVANSTGFTVSRFDPTHITRAINDAARETYPWLSRRLVDDSLIAGNWLRNGGFEDWASSTACDFWPGISAATISRTTAEGSRRYGTYSLGLVASTDDGAQQTDSPGSNPNKRLLDLAASTVKFIAWVKGANTTMRLRIYDGTTLTNSGAPASTANQWSRLTAETTIGSAPRSEVTFRIVVNAGSYTFYVDQARVIGPPVYDYYLPASFVTLQKVERQVHGFDSTYICDDLGQRGPWELLTGWEMHYDGTDRRLYFPYNVGANRKLRLTGRGYLTALSADTDTAEIDGTDIRVLVACAAYKLYEMYAGLVAGADRARYESEANRFYQKYLALRAALCRPDPVTLPF